jgi:hypothetical protein
VFTISAPPGMPVYVGGQFSSVGGQARTNAVALDVATGAPTAWNPGLTSDDETVSAIAVSGSTVYVGGNFQFMIGGQPRVYLAALDATTGNATTWNPGTDYTISCLQLIGSELFVGGGFTTIAGETRPGIAALNAFNGVADGWNPDELVGATCMVVDGTNAYAGSSIFSLRGVYAISLSDVSVTGAPATPPLELAQNRPNPAGSNTLIEFTLPQAAPVTLSVFDLAGRRVASLLEGEMRPAGVNRVPFRPAGLASGMYLYKVEALGLSAARKMIVTE